MTDLKMDCMGSVILHGKDGYCGKCPLFDECAVAAQENRVHMEVALSQPVFAEDGKFWVGAARRRAQKREVSNAQLQGEAPPAPPAPRKPAPIAMAATFLTPYEASTQPDLPVKVRQELLRWVRKGVDPHVIAGASTNPFATVTGFAFAHSLVEVLLQEGPMTKSALLGRVADFHSRACGKAWATSSVQSNVNIILGALGACGINLLKETE